MSCSYNFREDFCKPLSSQPNECVDATRAGALIVHGVADSLENDASFFRHLSLVFLRLYPYNFSARAFVADVKQDLNVYNRTICADAGDTFYKRAADSV